MAGVEEEEGPEVAIARAAFGSLGRLAVAVPADLMNARIETGSIFRRTMIACVTITKSGFGEKMVNKS